MWDSLLFNLDSLAGFYQGFIVCGEKSRVAKGDKLPRRGGPGACSPKNLLNEYASKCNAMQVKVDLEWNWGTKSLLNQGIMGN